MAKFVFKLQSYLKVKEKIEEQRKLEYGKSIRKLEEEKAVKRRLESEEDERFSGLREDMEAGISAEGFIRQKQYLVHLEKGINKQEGAIKRAENFAESKRVELVAAMKEKKMVETLKEHEYEEFLAEENKQEQKSIDEVVSYRYQKRLTEE